MLYEILFFILPFLLIQTSEGVHLSLNGVVYANNSAIPITEIGQTNTISNTGLQCITDKRPCCVSNRAGEWYFPDGTTTVPIQVNATSFYRNRGDDGTVNLNRLNTTNMMPTGLFCCEVPDAAAVLQRVCTNIVPYGIMITSESSSIPTAGDTYTLECSVSGAANRVIFEWFDDNEILLSNVSLLQFSSLLASHAGTYTCQATVEGVVVKKRMIVTISLPAPASVAVTPPTGIIIAGSSPSLTCTVELSSAVDIEVTVNTMWTGPDIMMIVTPTSSMIVNLTRYVIMVNVDAARGGSYTCQASIDSSSQFITESGMTSGSTNINVASLPPPINLMATSHTAMSITLTWNHPVESIVENYMIKYNFTVNHCPTYNIGEGYMEVVSGSLREYAIMNSPTTPVEEDSHYFISLIALNSVGESIPNYILVSTMQARPSEAPQSVMVIAKSTTTVTIRWERIRCSKRNGAITGYRIDYTSTFHIGSMPAASTITEISVTGLQPQTRYMFKVKAVNSRGSSPPATVTNTTLLPEAVSFFLGDHFYGNNSIVNLTDIGERSQALFCISNHSYSNRNLQRDWYFPNGSIVQPIYSAAKFYRSKDHSVARLHRRGNTLMPIGVFHCHIEVNGGIVQDIYVGVYPPNSGSPSITSLLFNRDLATLICTSTGGPPTTVTWRKNSLPLDSSLFRQSQILVNANGAIYNNFLTGIDNVANSHFIGNFTCTVTNSRGENTSVIDLNGISITGNEQPFVIGGIAEIICSSDSLADEIMWVNDTDSHIVATTSTDNNRVLTLRLNPVTATMNGTTYSCIVRRNQTFIFPIQQQQIRIHTIRPEISVHISSEGQVVASQNHSIDCQVLGINSLDASVNYQWSKDGSLIHTMAGRSNPYTFNSLSLSDAGDYTCEINVSSPYLNSPVFRDANFTLRIKIPAPSMTIVSIPDVNEAQLYIGSTLIIWCAASTIVDKVSVTITWDSPQNSNLQSENGSLIFNPLRAQDSGFYVCHAHVQPAVYHGTLITNGMNSSMLNIALIEPIQYPPNIIANSTRLPNSAPYNTLMLLCSASLPEVVVVPLRFIWRRQLSNSYVQFEPDFSVESRINRTTNQSALITNFTIPGEYHFECQVQLDRADLQAVQKKKSISIIVTSSIPPIMPINIREADITPHAVTLHWTVSRLAYTPETYTVYYENSTVNLISTESQSGANFSFHLNLALRIHLTSLSPGTAYTYYISATNKHGTTNSSKRTFITLDLPSSPVTDLSLTGINTTTINVAWNRPSNPNGAILLYNIEISDRQDNELSLIQNVTATNAQFSNLSPGVPYYATVIPINLAGRGGPATSEGFTMELEPLTAPRNVTVMRITPSSIEVSWLSLSLEEARGFVSSYTVAYQSGMNNFSLLAMYISVPGNQTIVVIDGLNPDFIYHVKVWANTSAGAGMASKAIVAEPLAMTASQGAVGAAIGSLFALIFIMAVIVLLGILMWRLRKLDKVKLFKLSVHYKRRHVSESLDDHDYTTAPISLESKQQEKHIESVEVQEEKDKDYYFMDTTLIAGEHVKPIPVSEFSNHVERLHADRDKLFEMEYEGISKHPLSSHSIADIPHNKCKNRFANIFPYDSSRVKLKEIAGEEGSDYINASHLDGYNKPKAYIGAQGPMPNTVSDFWRMIWEKKLPTVVMLTRVFEGRKKCEEYWPVIVGESVQPGHGLTITLTSVLPFAEYSLRKMTLTCSTAPGSAPLKVTQFHFTGWPDHGVPQNGVTLINFIKRVRTAHPYTDSRPLLVHCSAGVGRTGAFIVLDSMLQRMKAEENLNIYEFLKQLRAQRVIMVQTQAQYNFIHDALNEFILCGDTEITAPNLRIVIGRLNKTKDGESGYSKQFNFIAQMSPGHSESDYTQANMECNVSKNRYPHILPNDHFRVMLRATTVTGSNYINASFVDGYRQRGAYIATQAPMENTVNDFWRMIWDYQSRSIVMLCRMKEDGKEACYPYLPEHKGDSEVYEKIKVKLVAKETTTDYTIQQLEVSEDKPHPQGHTSSGTEQPVVKVGVFHYLRWPKHGTPRGTSALLELIQYINKTQMASGNKPITVMCNNGVGRTGTFICIHAQLERLKTEGVVDFFQFIKSARVQRAGLVPEVHQYILCHNLVADYLDGFDTYANFKELV